jgi:hypothetical protein
MTNASVLSNVAPPRGMTRLQTFAHCVAGTGFVINVITGLGTKYLYGEVEGWPLLIHMIGAGMILAGMAGIALTWADRCRFGAETGLNPLQKIVFWVSVVLALTLMLPILTAMLPLYGTRYQELALQVHELSGWLLLMVMVVHTVVSLAARRAKR